MDQVGKLAAEDSQKQSFSGMFSTTLLHLPFIVHFRECHSKRVACDMFHKRYNVTHYAGDCPMPPKKTTTLNLRVDPAIKGAIPAVDVTDEVDAASGTVLEKIADMITLTTPGSTAPDARTHFSKLCHNSSVKKTVCWNDIENFTIYEVVHAAKIPALEAMDFLYLRDIPDDFDLSDRDRRNVTRINRND